MPVGPDPSDAGAAPLDGRTFVSTSTRGGHLAAGASIRLVFVDGLLVVSGGCNSMRGRYEHQQGRLQVPGPMAATMMACAQDLMDQDQWLAGMFAEGVDASLVGERLTLATDGVLIELVESDAEPVVRG